MRTPTKLVIEITGHEYSHTLLDADGNVMWGDKHIMESAGCAKGVSGTEEIYDSDVAEEYDELAEAIDDLTFGPFGVATALRNIADEI